MEGDTVGGGGGKEGLVLSSISAFYLNFYIILWIIFNLDNLGWNGI